jgi:hypothetical protein
VRQRSGPVPLVPAGLAPVGHRDRNGGKIGTEIARRRRGSETVFPACHTDRVGRTARTGRVLGLLFGHFQLDLGTANEARAGALVKKTES